MSAKAEIKPLIYYNIRKCYWSQLINLCDPPSKNSFDITKNIKGPSQSSQSKDPVLIFWKAFGMV